MGWEDRIESSALSYLTVSSRGRGTPTEFNELVRSGRDRRSRFSMPTARITRYPQGLTYAAQDFRAACNSSLSR